MTDHRQGVPHRYASFVRSLPGEYYLRSEVASELGISKTSLIDLADEPHNLGPSFSTHRGKVLIYLYTAEDVEKLRLFLADRYQPKPNGLPVSRPGRPMLWSGELRAQRSTRLARRRYMLKRADQHAARGQHEVAADYRRLAAEMKVELDRELAERAAYCTRPRVRE